MRNVHLASPDVVFPLSPEWAFLRDGEGGQHQPTLTSQASRRLKCQLDAALFFFFFFWEREGVSYPLLEQVCQILADPFTGTLRTQKNLVSPSSRSPSQLCLKITNEDVWTLLYDDD